MRRLAHLSDLHFGREDDRLVEGLIADLAQVQPHLTVVSGDLTQRARRRQFEAAAAFLQRLPGPRLVVPGNHDIPLFDVFRRFLDPLGRYRRLVHHDIDPFFADAELAVLGLNTARPDRWKDGALSEEQIDAIRVRFGPLDAGIFKVIVTHHPFVSRGYEPEPVKLERAGKAIAIAEECGVELFLAGHLHHGYLADLRQHHATLKRSILVAQAGTALSHRRRGEPNGYNLVTIDPPEVAFDVRAWNGTRFDRATQTRYRLSEGGWDRV